MDEETGFDPDWLYAHSRVAAREWCPRCEPEIDPIQDYVTIQLCRNHQPTVDGLDDQRTRYASPAALDLIDGV